MKHILTSLLLLITVIAGAQIPAPYLEKYQQAEKIVENNIRTGRDFYLDPIEYVAIEPTAAAMEAGNWGNTYFGITPDVIKVIQSKAIRAVAVYTHDTGAELVHPALYKVVRNDLGKNFTPEPTKRDQHGHSTHVTGCFAAVDPAGNMLLGTAGALVDINKLIAIPYKVMESNGSGDWGWVAKSVRTATDEGIKLQAQGYFVIHNLSLGGSSDDAELAAAIKRARDAGQFVIVAAGNNGAAQISFPARTTGANCVGALANANGDRASYSNYGPQMYVAAPGSGILSCWPDGTYKQNSGTSMAAPEFVGLLAIAASINPTATANQLEWMLANTTRDLYTPGWDQYTGYGASLIQKILAADPLKYPNTPITRPTTPTPDPVRDARQLTFTMPAFKTVWKSTGALQNLEVNLTVSFTSNKYDEKAFDELKAASELFFTNRGFGLLPQHGIVDATYYVRHFYEMLVKQNSGLDVKVVAITGKDDAGRIAIPPDKKTLDVQTLKFLKKQHGVFSYLRAPIPRA